MMTQKEKYLWELMYCNLVAAKHYLDCFALSGNPYDMDMTWAFYARAIHNRDTALTLYVTGE
jgi:hypothetical protein